MRIAFLITLTMLSCFASKSAVCSLESLMRETLKLIMKCPQNEDDYTPDRPVAAFSPARYTQLVAVARKDSEELPCGSNIYYPFDINDPRTWNFCAMGVCLSEKCYCFKDFSGKKCNKFQEKCWLFYCYRIGCNLELPSLYCVCDPSLHGTAVTERIYFYDHGIEESYRPPPLGYVTTDIVESHIIRETLSGNFEVIGGKFLKANPYDSSSLKESQYKNNRISRNIASKSIHKNRFSEDKKQSPSFTLKKGKSRNPLLSIDNSYTKNNLKSRPHNNNYDKESFENSKKPYLKKRKYKYSRRDSTVDKKDSTQFLKKRKLNYNNQISKKRNYLNIRRNVDQDDTNTYHSGTMNYFSSETFINPYNSELEWHKALPKYGIPLKIYSAINYPKNTLQTDSIKNLRITGNYKSINRRKESTLPIMWADSIEEDLQSFVTSGNEKKASTLLYTFILTNVHCFLLYI